MIYVAAFCVAFVSVFLKGFQFKNMQHNKWWGMFTTSYVMGVFEFTAAGAYATIFIQGSWWWCFVNGAAAALAIVSATWAHTKWFPPETSAVAT